MNKVICFTILGASLWLSVSTASAQERFGNILKSEYMPEIHGTIRAKYEYEEKPEMERLIETRTLVERLKVKVNLLGHHVSNTVPITGALPDDRAAILQEFDKAIAELPEQELKDYQNRIWHL